MTQKPKQAKGTRDFSPEEVAKRNYIINTIKNKFQHFGFQPIETPSFERFSTLMGKYGEEGDRLIFKILKSGDYAKSLRKLIDDIKISKNFVLEILKKLRKETAHLDIDSKKVHADPKYKKEIKNKIFVQLDLQEIIDKEFIDYNKERLQFFRELEIGGAISKRLSGKLIDLIIYGVVSSEASELFVRMILMEEVENEIFKYLEEKESSVIISDKALRYDLTVPFARYVVQHQNELNFPFKRYQIQPVWRADRPQKGRFREFFQCDADVIGSNSIWQEVEFVQLYDEVFSDLKLDGVTIKLNNRKILSGLAEVIGESDKLIAFTTALDKLDKIGEEGVKNEMLNRGISEQAIAELSPIFKMEGSFSDKIKQLKQTLHTSEIGLKGVEELEFIQDAISEMPLKTTVLDLDVTLARGLDYYTGAILEVAAPESVKIGSIGGGGRYDDLTGIFGLKDMSGMGISFGLDRIYLALQELGLFPETVLENTKVLFVNFGDKEALYGLKAIAKLRENGVAAELYPETAKMKKQMNFADKRAIPFVVLAGSKEMEAEEFTLKNMKSGKQEVVDFEVLLNGVANG